jgi:hypothetical protein
MYRMSQVMSTCVNCQQKFRLQVSDGNQFCGLDCRCVMNCFMRRFAAITLAPHMCSSSQSLACAVLALSSNIHLVFHQTRYPLSTQSFLSLKACVVFDLSPSSLHTVLIHKLAISLTPRRASSFLKVAHMATIQQASDPNMQKEKQGFELQIRESDSKRQQPKKKQPQQLQAQPPRVHILIPSRA